MGKYKVLLLEDDDSAKKQLSKAISREGFEVIVAEDGKKGLEVFEKERPDIVITDINMPEVDGLEVLHRIKRMAPDTHVIMVTGFGELETIITVLREGALDYIKKPIDLDKLSLALGRAKEKLEHTKKYPFYPGILIAEDDEDTRVRLKRVLEKEKWRVYEAKDGQEAVDEFDKQTIDVVLLDINMPKLNGVQALEKMRKSSNGENFEAIILTGFGEEETAINALRCGALNYLKKPVDLDHLILNVERALEKLSLTRSLRYRNRELQLTHEMLASVTANQEIIIDLSKPLEKETINYAKKFIDELLITFFVVSKNFKINYMNNKISHNINPAITELNEEFVKTLAGFGINNISLNSMKKAINCLNESAVTEDINDSKIEEIVPGKILKIKESTHGYILFSKIKVLLENKAETAVVVALRGERYK